MLDHVSITIADLDRAEVFYDAVFAALGVVKVGADPEAGWVGYGERCDGEHPDRAYLSLRAAAGPKSASGRHWGFKAPNREAVDAFWRAGLAHGGSDDGPPGLRPQYHPSYYAAFLIDPDGNRIEAVCHAVPDPAASSGPGSEEEQRRDLERASGAVKAQSGADVGRARVAPA